MLGLKENVADREHRKKALLRYIMKLTYYSPTQEILTEIGKRLKVMRISKTVSQKELAEETGLSIRTISNLESGKDVSLSTLIEVLRGLNQLPSLEMLIPDQSVRPSQLMEYGSADFSKKRVSRKAAAKAHSGNGWKWGDEK